MRRMQFCLVPEGDSPESSRLYDAIATLCIPVVISSRIAVPPSRAWSRATIQIKPREFWEMNASALLSRLDASTLSCADQLELRRDVGALAIIDRLAMRFSTRHETIGRR